MKRFEEDIDSVVADTVDMCNTVCDMIDKAVRSFVDGDTETAQEVIGMFPKVDGYDNTIEESALRILTIYQPTAMDARTVATIMKSITYLERIAKYSVNIAKATIYLADKPLFEPVNLIGPVGDVATRMVRLVVKAFEEGTVDGLEKISEMDDYLDRTMRDDLIQIVEFINRHEQSADVCTYYISVIKFIERVGDHACKMAEKVSFMVTGTRVHIE